jgi:hypothetical protein
LVWSARSSKDSGVILRLSKRRPCLLAKTRPTAFGKSIAAATGNSYSKFGINSDFMDLGSGSDCSAPNPAECRTGLPILVIPRKEVIQPHLPIRLPCYDLVPLTGITLGTSSLAVRTITSGAANSGGLTGGVYKAQEQIHRGVADPRLLAIPASCGRIAAHNLN